MDDHEMSSPLIGKGNTNIYVRLLLHQSASHWLCLECTSPNCEATWQASLWFVPYLKSFKRNSTFASGRAQRTTSLQSLSFNELLFAKYFARACCAFCRAMLLAFVFFATTFNLCSSFRASRLFCAMSVTPALPIRESHKFQCPEAEKALPLLRSCSTCSSAVEAQSTCKALGTIDSRMPGLNPIVSIKSNSRLYLSYNCSSPPSCVRCPNSFLTLGFLGQLQVHGTNPIFAHELRIFAFKKW